MVMLRGVYIRHVVDGVPWSDPVGLMAVDWCVIKHWRPGWWQGWLFFGAFMLIGLRTLQIGIRIRRAELARGD